MCVIWMGKEYDINAPVDICKWYVECIGQNRNAVEFTKQLCKDCFRLS